MTRREGCARSSGLGALLHAINSPWTRNTGSFLPGTNTGLKRAPQTGHTGVASGSIPKTGPSSVCMCCATRPNLLSAGPLLYRQR